MNTNTSDYHELTEIFEKISLIQPHDRNNDKFIITLVNN